jgi:P-type Ca2+ transporter type 2C
MPSLPLPSDSPPWHTLPPEQVLRRLDTVASGLAPAAVEERRHQYGDNELTAAEGVNPWRIFLEQFKNLLIIILLAATVISAVLSHTIEAAAIVAIVLFAVLLGFVQEYRAGNALLALRRMAAPTARVLRGGIELILPARELVPGDIVLLQAGDRVPADLRLLVAVNLRSDEASLTGESLPVAKQAGALVDPELAVADRSNLTFAGTNITYGRGRGIVIATGMATEFGRISGLLQGVAAERTPLQENLDRVGRQLAIAAGVVVTIIVLLGWLRGAPLVEMLIFGIALAVAVVPEALPAVVTISLAIGMQRLLKCHALANHLATVETLGSTAVICSDKTGTLTCNQMTVRRIWVAGTRVKLGGEGYRPEGSVEGETEELPGGALRQLLVASVLANDASLVQHEGEWTIHGDPTEGALLVAAVKAGLDLERLATDFPRTDEVPFSSESKFMLTLHRVGEGTLACAKGAPEVILARCGYLLTAGGVEPLDDVGRRLILAEAGVMAEQALRVMAVASCSNATLAAAEGALTFLGLTGMIDPPRPEAFEAIRTCKAAGIKPVMITGDHPQTARAIAGELGILKGGELLTGPELEKLSAAELAARVGKVEVYARVSPEHKLRVVEAWRSRGKVVAMTGDGVNDAPALKLADVGIAMGITGTDVSKQAADITLTDDNFASIIAAIREGRGIFGNIKKYLMYLLSSNLGEIGLLGGAALLGWPLPLTAVQILYVNLATDGLPALALAVDPPEEDLMRQPPRDPRRGIFTRPVILLMLVGGTWSTLVNLGLFGGLLAAGRPLEHAMALTFLSLVLIQFLKAYCFRSERHSLLRRPFANRWLNLAILWELLLFGLIIYLPFLQKAFGTYALSPGDWGLATGAAATVLPVMELAKLLLQHRALEPGG